MYGEDLTAKMSSYERKPHMKMARVTLIFLLPFSFLLVISTSLKAFVVHYLSVIIKETVCQNQML